MLVEVREHAPGHFNLTDPETNKIVLYIDNDYKALEIAISLGFIWAPQTSTVEGVIFESYDYLKDCVGAVFEPKDWWVDVPVDD